MWSCAFPISNSFLPANYWGKPQEKQAHCWGPKVHGPSACHCTDDVCTETIQVSVCPCCPITASESQVSARRRPRSWSKLHLFVFMCVHTNCHYCRLPGNTSYIIGAQTSIEVTRRSLVLLGNGQSRLMVLPMLSPLRMWTMMSPMAEIWSCWKQRWANRSPGLMSWKSSCGGHSQTGGKDILIQPTQNLLHWHCTLWSILS